VIVKLKIYYPFITPMGLSLASIHILSIYQKALYLIRVGFRTVFLKNIKKIEKLTKKNGKRFLKK